MKKDKAYFEKVNIENELKLREHLKALPHFCRDFFIGIEPTTSSPTRIPYASALGFFFDLRQKNNLAEKKLVITEFPFTL